MPSNESISLILDSIHRLCILRAVPRCDMADILRERQILYIRKIWHISTGFVLLVRATYSDCLCSTGARRSVMLPWACSIGDERMESPEVPDAYFNRAAATGPQYSMSPNHTPGKTSPLLRQRIGDKEGSNTPRHPCY